MVRAIILSLLATLTVMAEPPGDPYRRDVLPIPADLQLEVSGITAMPDGRLALCIRKGEVWLVDGVSGVTIDPDKVTYKQYATGLHEPLGITWHNGALFVTQRSEVTRLEDSDGDDIADAYLTAAKGWGVSGNYHEYAYGPVFDRDGNGYINLNCSIGKGVNDRRQWRGWSIQFSPDGAIRPVSGGMRSPIGIGVNQRGDIFGTDHQGNWFAACPLYQIKPGVFHGHADALADCDRPGATFKIDGKLPTNLTVGELAAKFPAYALPAVWFPYRKMGQGSTGIACDLTRGSFGPFQNQLFVGDFTNALISRVDLEIVKGEYQGACFPFQDNFQSAVISLAFGKSGHLFVGETNRGWNSQGSRSFGLERLSWTGTVPFEILSMHARHDGFELTFTAPVDAATAANPTAYQMSSFTYPHHPAYGGDELNTQTLQITSAVVSQDRLRVVLTVEALRPTYVHELHLDGVRSATGGSLQNPVAYYTLNQLPD